MPPVQSWMQDLKKLLSVRRSHVIRNTAYVKNVTALTWRQVRKSKSARQLVSSLRSRSVSRVHSLQCVRSIQVELPGTILHRVFRVSKRFSKHGIQKGKPTFQKSKVKLRKSMKFEKVKKKLPFKAKWRRGNILRHTMLA